MKRLTFNKPSLCSLATWCLSTITLLRRIWGQWAQPKSMMHYRWKDECLNLAWGPGLLPSYTYHLNLPKVPLNNIKLFQVHTVYNIKLRFNFTSGIKSERVLKEVRRGTLCVHTFVCTLASASMCTGVFDIHVSSERVQHMWSISISTWIKCTFWGYIMYCKMYDLRWIRFLSAW